MDYKEVARRIAEESIVLLKNDEKVLPFSKDKKLAIFGRTQLETIASGNGSGAAGGADITQITEECIKAGLKPEESLIEFYKEQIQLDQVNKLQQMQEMHKNLGIDMSDLKSLMNSGIIYEIFGKYQAPATEFEVPVELCEVAAKETDTALLIIGRNSGGEECDRHVDNDYYLTSEEDTLIERVCKLFSKVVVVVNANGMVDLNWTEKYPEIKSILFIGVPGEQGAVALARILTGQATPSGKLAFTLAKSYEDYPTAAHFSWNKDNVDSLLTYEDYGLDAAENGSVGFDKSLVTVYWESIYMGYRYFDTFKKEVQFPFGYGLSYAEFKISADKPYKRKDEIVVPVTVANISETAGKEVVQLYITAPGVGIERPYQEFKSCKKTKLLQAGEEEKLEVTFKINEIACYDEATARYIIEPGTYMIRIGNASNHTQVAGTVTAKDIIVTAEYQNKLVLKECNKDKINFLTRLDHNMDSIMLKQENDILISLDDIIVKKTMGIASDKKEVLKELSIEELASLCVGYGPGTPFAALSGGGICTISREDGTPMTENSHPSGYVGYVSPAIKEKGIYSISYKDGPAGVGVTAWPSEMLMACSFNMDLLYEFGDAVGAEAESLQVDSWLAPAVNLHRNPIGGRNFEYYSEDPVLSGMCGLMVALGVQENHKVMVCPKHFAINEQETYRRGKERLNIDAVDSIITERAARELYLKPFEMIVRGAKVRNIMTSFNKINGTFAAGNADLCNGILREEWGFEGAIVTDWGDMDYYVNGADAVAAGNDIVMPGGPPVIKQILDGYKEGRVTREHMEAAVNNLLRMMN